MSVGDAVSLSDPDTGRLAALAGLPGMGPVRLRQLLRHHEPSEALDVLAGRHRADPSIDRLLDGDLGRRWRAEVASVDLDAIAERCRSSGVRGIAFGSPAYPAVLLDDPAPPAVLFVRGDLSVLAARRVGVIGTRNATQSGLATARALGEGLARAGVGVVSGLARGIDGAAHRGAIDAEGTPIAVVGNGPDQPYPRQHRQLWDEVVHRGLLVSEWPPGTPPDAFRFPMRNRILAALCEVLVVVESREHGGSLLTVEEAALRSVDVMAVPGSPRSRASVGANRLLRDGAAPVTCTDDVLVALGLDTRRQAADRFDSRPAPSAVERVVLDACRDVPRTLDELAATLDRPLAEVAMALARLERSGRVVETRGWFEVTEPWAHRPS